MLDLQSNGNLFHCYVTICTLCWVWWNGRKDWISVIHSQAVTCTFFTNLARWKFPYENRLVEISLNRTIFSHTNDALAMAVVFTLEWNWNGCKQLLEQVNLFVEQHLNSLVKIGLFENHKHLHHQNHAFTSLLQQNIGPVGNSVLCFWFSTRAS